MMEQIYHPTQQNSLGLNNSTRKRVRTGSRKLFVYLILLVFGFLLGMFCKAEAAVAVDNLKTSADMENLHTLVFQDIQLDSTTDSSTVAIDDESSEKTVQTDSKSNQQSISTETKSDIAQKVVPKNTNPTFVAEDLQEKAEGNYHSDSQNGKIAQAQYKINVSLKDQCVKIYNNGELVKEFAVSTGTDNSTPTGDFEIQNRGEWFFSGKYQEGAK